MEDENISSVSKLVLTAVFLILLIAFTQQITLYGHAEGADSGTGTSSGEPSQTSSEVNVISGIGINIKYGSTDIANIQSVLENLISSEAGKASCTVASISWNSFPSSFVSDGTINCTINYSDSNYENEIVSYKIVNPTEYVFKNTTQNIYSNSDYNKSNSTLLSYVNSDLQVVGTGDEYKDAVGSGTVYTAAQFTWKDCSSSYKATGNSYTFTQKYSGISLVRTFNVTEAYMSSPSVDIDYGSNTISTTSQMRWSLNRTSWNNCSSNMSIQSSWCGQYVYFYYPATNYYEASDTTRVYIPIKADKPTTSLKLTATTHTITITNCWDYDSCMFSIDGSSWVSTNNEYYTFKGLTENKSYKVYVRTKAKIGKYLVSDYVASSISTKKSAETGINIKYSAAKNIGYVDGTGTVAYNSSTTTLSGSFDTSDFARFNNIVSGYRDLYSTVYSTLLINHVSDDYDTSSLVSAKFYMPLSAVKVPIQSGNLGIQYKCNLGSASLNNSSLLYYYNKSSGNNLSFSIDKIKSISDAKYAWIKSQLSDDRPVYKLSVAVGSNTSANVAYSIPYELDNRETADGLRVYYIDDSGNKMIIDCKYDSKNKAVIFTTNKVGYFVISYDYTSDITLPFKDITKDHWAYSYIKYCYSRAMFNGVSGSKFDTKSNVDRATIIVLLARLNGFDTSSSITSTYFNDVCVGDWYAAGANWAYTKGLVQGDSFNPKDPMTREDIAYIIYKYMMTIGYSGKTNTELNYADLTEIDSNNRQAVAYLKDFNIMQGDAENRFNPSKNVTRAEMAALLYRLGNLIK